MCTNLLGPSLATLYNFCNNSFSLNTTISIGIDSLDLLERLHSTGFVHNDIKPDNFVIDLDVNYNLNLIDFGFATRYLNEKSKKHIENGSTNYFKGTRFYASLSNLKYMQLSRRDDLESLSYMLINFLYPKLLEELFLIISIKLAKKHIIKVL